MFVHYGDLFVCLYNNIKNLCVLSHHYVSINPQHGLGFIQLIIYYIFILKVTSRLKSSSLFCNWIRRTLTEAGAPAPTDITVVVKLLPKPRGIEITLASVRSSIGFIREIALGIFNLDLGRWIAPYLYVWLCGIGPFCCLDKGNFHEWKLFLQRIILCSNVRWPELSIF